MGSKYDAAFKRETIRMLEQEVQGAAEVSVKIGVHIKTLYRWLSEYRVDGKDAFPGKGCLKPADEELRRLQRENSELGEENEILKKAAAIFAKHRP